MKNVSCDGFVTSKMIMWKSECNLYSPGSSPSMVPLSSPSPYPRHTWQEDGTSSKPPSTPGTPDHTGAQNEQVFMQQAPGSSISSPDPYMFDPFSPTQTRPGARPPHRLPGLQAFGASSPRDDEGLFAAPGMSPRLHQSSDVFGHSAAAGPDMFTGASRRAQGTFFSCCPRWIFSYFLW